ncbi:MAG: hypothetical protein C4542_08915 [Dehalococcoidia bacterium]|nr:MAG: hypothetical protein C4542_08915 [Dehalococcoidia bacterium]
MLEAFVYLLILTSLGLISLSSLRLSAVSFSLALLALNVNVYRPDLCSELPPQASQALWIWLSLILLAIAVRKSAGNKERRKSTKRAIKKHIAREK